MLFMKTKSLVFTLVGVLVVSLSVASARSGAAGSFAKFGGDSSGGGSAIMTTPGSPLVLYDLYRANPQFRENAFGAKLVSVQPGAYYGVESLPVIWIEQQPGFQEAQRLLAPWRRTSPLLVEAILKTAKRMWWYKTEHRLKPQDQGGFDEIQKEKVQTIAVYVSSFKGSVISEPVFNALGRRSQAGLFIHEALRHVQLAQLFYGVRPFLDREIERLTATLTLHSPASLENSFLDQIYLSDDQQRAALERAGDEHIYDRLRLRSLCYELSDLIRQEAVRSRLAGRLSPRLAGDLADCSVVGQSDRPAEADVLDFTRSVQFNQNVLKAAVAVDDQKQLTQFFWDLVNLSNSVTRNRLTPLLSEKDVAKYRLD
jgi:hypothetical protein